MGQAESVATLVTLVTKKRDAVIAVIERGRQKPCETDFQQLRNVP